MLKPILVATFVAVVILSECLFAWMLIPSTADLQDWAKAKANDPEAAADVKKAEPAAAEAKPAHDAKDSHGAKDDHGKPAAGHGASDHGKPAAGHGDHGGGHSPAAAHGTGHEHEVDLGKFNVVIHQPAADVTLRVNFHLIGIVSEKEHHEFTELLARNQHRLRDHVLSEIRNAETSDLTDPGLGLIKRRILATSNQLLGKPILQTILFSDFSFVEQ